MWQLLCGCFCHSAGLRAKVTLDGAACRLCGLGGVRDVLGVLVVWKEKEVKKRKCSWKKARERTTMDETRDTPDDLTYSEHNVENDTH